MEFMMPAQDNSAILAKLDELLADDCTLAREYHEKRRSKAEPSDAE